jgi:hypothetical protein
MSLNWGTYSKKSCRLNPVFGPAPAFLGLDRRYEPRSAQPRKVGRMAIGIGCGKRLDGRRTVVIASASGDRVEKRALPVRARTVQEGKRMLPDRARECIPGESLQEPDQIGIRLRDLLEKRDRAPCRCPL